MFIPIEIVLAGRRELNHRIRLRELQLEGDKASLRSHGVIQRKQRQRKAKEIAGWFAHKVLRDSDIAKNID